jgi:hypothetical protein
MHELESKFNNLFNAFERVFGPAAATNADPAANQETKLLTAFRSLDQSGRDKLLSYAEDMAKQGVDAMNKQNAFMEFERTLQRAAASGQSVSFH